MPTVDRAVMRDQLSKWRGQRVSREQVYTRGYEQARVLHTEYVNRPIGVGSAIVLGGGAAVVGMGVLGVPRWG